MSGMAISCSVKTNDAVNPFTDTYVGLLKPQPLPSLTLGVARTLTSVHKGRGIVRFVNLTNKPVSLGAECPLGQFFSITGNKHDEYPLVSSVTPSTEAVHPVHLKRTWKIHIILQQEVSKLLDYNIIDQSQSPRSVPFVLVQKKDGTRRFCVEYRCLEATIKDSHPLPQADDTHDRLSCLLLLCVFSLSSVTLFLSTIFYLKNLFYTPSFSFL